MIKDSKIESMDNPKSHIKYLIVKQIVFAILAVLVFVFRAIHIQYLKYFVGGLMLFYGLEEQLFELIYSRSNMLKQGKVYLGLSEIILGIVVLAVEIDYDSVCIIWAVWSILRESYEIKEIFADLQFLVPKVLSGVESIAVIVFSILLIIEPAEHHAMIHLYLLLVELILTPFVPLLDELLEKKKHLNSP